MLTKNDQKNTFLLEKSQTYGCNWYDCKQLHCALSIWHKTLILKLLWINKLCEGDGCKRAADVVYLWKVYVKSYRNSIAVTLWFATFFLLYTSKGLQNLVLLELFIYSLYLFGIVFAWSCHWSKNSERYIILNVSRHVYKVIKALILRNIGSACTV